MRERYGWFDHLARMIDRYVNNHGYHFAASITYFSVLSLIPLLMVLLAVAAFVLAGHPYLLGELRNSIHSAVPGALGPLMNTLVNNVIDHRVKLGIFGLVVGLYSGWNWMNALRDALTGMWDQRKPDLPLLHTIVRDLMALGSLAIAIAISFGLTEAGAALGGWVLRLLGWSGFGWANVGLQLASVVLALVADWLVFCWVLTKLPREPVPLRFAVRGAAGAAVAFETLKRVANLYLNALGASPIGATFGSIIGLLVFVYLVSRVLILAAAWTATAQPQQRPAPDPIVIAPAPNPVLTARAALGLVGFGAIAVLVLQRLSGVGRRTRQ
ncbi:MAG TPA: YhjD/YihY/BrkB family envelope integrity protein [Pseudonocardiaceae bacterium]